MTDAAEKVIEASPERRRKALRQGDVPVSGEANTAAAMAGFLLSLFAVAPFTDDLAGMLLGFLLRPESSAAALLSGGQSGALVFAAIAFVLPMTVLPALMVIASLAVQQGIVFAPTRIKPDLKKVSPIDNAGKKFGPQGLVEFARNAAKITVLTVAGGAVLAREASRLAVAYDTQAAALPALLLRQLIVFFMLSTCLAVVFAALDVPLVRAQRDKRLRMSRQEAQDEAKENEGDQNIKAQRRRRAEKIALNRMLADVRTADVLIVNPTHYSVALKWERQGESLPVCVAKGTDDVALRLRQAARDAGVPIRDDPPCARSLHATVGIGDAIRPEHFAAVAAAIRFADKARRLRR